MAIAEINIIPLGTKTPSVSKYLVPALRTLKQEKNVKCEITAMGTVIEGSLDELLRIVKNMHESTLGGEIKRVVTIVMIDDRQDKPLSASGKIESLLKKLDQ